MDYSFEPMTKEHRVQVIDIYNYFIEKSFAAYPSAAVDDSMFDRFLALSMKLPALVVKDMNGAVVGFGFLQPYLPLDSFRKTAVATYFILPEHTRKGIGAKMLEMFMNEARKKGIEHLLANISSLNPGSIEFHRKNGFRKCGALDEIGTKAGRSFSVIWMQRNLKI